MARGRSRIVPGVALALLGLLSVLAASYRWGLPYYLRRRMAESASRHGLELEVGDVEIGLHHLRLGDVSVRLASGGLVVDVDEADLSVDLVDAFSEGSAAISEVSLGGVHLALDLEDSAALAWISEQYSSNRDGAASSGEASAEARVRSRLGGVQLSNVSLLLTDREGTLVDVEGLRATYREGFASVHTGVVNIAEARDDHVGLESASIELNRESTEWALSRAEAVDVSISYHERDAEVRNPLLSRLRRHQDSFSELGILPGTISDNGEAADWGEPGGEGDLLDRAVSAEQGVGEESPSEDASSELSPCDEPASGEEAAENELAAEGSDDDRELDAEPGAIGEDSPSHRLGQIGLAGLSSDLLSERLSVGAELSVQGLQVVAVGAEGAHSVLSEFRMRIIRSTADLYRLEGAGRPGVGGRLSWDMQVEPVGLRASGDVEFEGLPLSLVTPFFPSFPWHQPEVSRLSGNLHVSSGEGQLVDLSGELSIGELSLSSSRIASAPIEHVELALNGEAQWAPETRRLSVSELVIESGGAQISMNGWLEKDDEHYAMELSVTLPLTPCDAAIGAIPQGLLGRVAEFQLSGQLGGRVALRVDSRDLEATELSINVADGCHFEGAPQLADVGRFEGPFMHRVRLPDGELFEMETGPTTLAWTPIYQISPFLVHAVLGHEDGGFFRHSGFAEHAIRLALIRNLRAGRYAFGASTITMQLVKNVFLFREKTIARKVQEVLLTWWVESRMEKERLLELYLNVIEYGPRIYGIRAASEHYFGREPNALSPAQSAYLATILPNPPAFHSHFEEGAVPDRFLRRVTRLLRTLGRRGRYDQAAVDDGVEELSDFHFYRPDEPVSEPRPVVGSARPLPFALGGEDSDFGEQGAFEQESLVDESWVEEHWGN